MNIEDFDELPLNLSFSRRRDPGTETSIGNPVTPVPDRGYKLRSMSMYHLKSSYVFLQDRGPELNSVLKCWTHHSIDEGQHYYLGTMPEHSIDVPLLYYAFFSATKHWAENLRSVVMLTSMSSSWEFSLMGIQEINTLLLDYCNSNTVS